MRMFVMIGLLVFGLFWYLIIADTPIVVNMNQTGYSPNNLTVAVGSTVMFKNDDEVDFWPAIDEHPTHTLYDGTTLEEHCGEETAGVFDACRPIKPGETWSFTFKNVGVFPFHDHLWPHLTGTITVVDGTNNVVAQNRTLGPYVQKVIDTDPRIAIETLKRDAASSSELYARCHEILHEIGKEAFYQYGSFEAASVFQDDFCNSGYIHGVFEAHFAEVTDPLIDLQQVCNTFAGPDQRPFDAWQCRHGIGHGFMYFTGGDLGDSLQLCTETFETEKAQEQCQNGVYMEIFNQEILAKEVDLVDKTDPAAICSTQEYTPDDCYTYLPSYLSQTLGMDMEEMFAFCETVPINHWDSCKLGVGSELMKRNMAEPTEAIARCNDFKNLRDQTICMSGLVSMYINQTGSLEQTQVLCQDIPEIYQVACQQVIGFRAKDF